MLKYTMKMIIYILVPIMLGVVSGEENRTVSCCPQDHYVLFRDTLCWEPKEKKTKPISLSCKTHMKIAKYSINPAGQLEIPTNNNYISKYDPDEYCLNNATTRVDVNLTHVQSIAVICITEPVKSTADSVLGYCMIVSVIFLAITALIFTLLPELRDLQGKSIIHFCSSSAIGLGMLVIINIIEYSNMDLCAIRGFLAYFFLIASFFWTNAISIQVWKSTRIPLFVDHGWRVFIWYALYAWGCPAILTVCMAIVNYYPGKHEKPGIGHNNCWFIDNKQQWYYMYSVMSILIAANVVIFIYASTIIWRSSFSSSHMKAVKFKLVMTVRLIILMGLPWIFEMISSLVERHIVWVMLDIFNALQGLLIFLQLVVFRRRAIKAMYTHGWLTCVSVQVEKWLAVGDDDEENVMEHSDLPMNDRI